MQTDTAIQLAVDVIQDHFGGAPARVALVLLQSGPLSVQDILRFSSQHDRIGETSLRFPSVRNALLTLLRHRVATARPHPQTGPQTNVGEGRMVYSVEIEEVLTRLRFPQFLEHISWRYGEVARELASVVLRYGSASASCIFEEAWRACGDKAARSELEAMFRRLVNDGLFHGVDPFRATVGDGVEGAREAGDGKKADDCTPPPSKQARVEATSIVAAGASGAGNSTSSTNAGLNGSGVPVYVYCRPVLNLLLCKNLLARLVESRVGARTAQVISAMLCAVTPSPSGNQPSAPYMRFGDIEQRMREIGATNEGRDPQRERERLRQVLDSLSVDGGLVKKRLVTAGKPIAGVSQPSVDDSREDEIAGNGGMKKAGRGGGKGQLDSEAPEWSIQWQEGKKMMLMSVRSQLIRDQFGTLGLRIFNLLNEGNPPQKLDESEIFRACMVPIAEGRDVLNSMVRRSFISWQEVPKSANTPLAASFWLYYVDRERAKSAMILSTLQAMLNLRIRFRIESAKVAPLESRAATGGLLAHERALLQAGRCREDALERSSLCLDAVLLAFLSF